MVRRLTIAWLQAISFPKLLTYHAFLNLQNHGKLKIQVNGFDWLLPKFMTVDNYSSEPVFFCLSNLLSISDSKKKIYPQLGIAITGIVSPVTILLNILVILAIKKTRE